MSTEGLSIGISVGGPGAGAADRAHRGSRRAALARRVVWAPLAIDATAILIAVLDVWLVIPEKAPPYSIYLSGLACLALAGRRWMPFGVVLLTVPGFLTGWSQLAAMIALGMLATRKQTHWQVWVGAALVWMCRFVQWPLSDFAQLSWREHVLDGIYGVLVAGMPIAIGLLIGARAQLSQKLGELAASRDRERKLTADAVRAEERARLAREMHDVVSHDITLIAMQAGVLTAQESPSARQTAEVIRQLSTRTLEELRSLVGVLRSGLVDEGPQPGIAELGRLVHNSAVAVRLTMDEVPEEVPPKVSAAAYRTVQEALTNVRKHAPGATATVLVRGEDGALSVEVCNERPPCEAVAELPSGGYGLTGLAERARLLGGSLETCSTEDGGFRVLARYPLGV